MKDPSDSIRDWLYTKLYTKVSYLTAVIPFYSMPPKDAAMPYIAVGEHMMTGEQGTKDAYITEHSVDIEIWTSFEGNDASYVMANTIADSVIQILRTRTKQTITGYNVIRVLVDNMITDRFLMETNIIIYKSINIRLLMEEN